MIDRRTLFAAAALLALPFPALAAPIRTQWEVGPSEGLDAVAFLGPLSGKAFYARHYEAELAAFKPRLKLEILEALASLHAEWDAADSLLWPSISVIFSGGPTDSLAAVIDGLTRAESVLKPAYQASVYWDQADWDRLIAGRERLLKVLNALGEAGFVGFRRGLIETTLAKRRVELGELLPKLDIIAEQERLLGRKLHPLIQIDLLWFCKPHGVKVQGQRFLSFVGARDQVVVLTAAHELLHPPFDMAGPTAKACLDVLGRDPLFTKILAEKDKGTGYNSLDGILNEDTAQALDQIIQERLGYVNKPAAERWSTGDQGMHVLAAGLYGLLKADGYDRTGGNLSAWMLAAVRSGKLSPDVLHPAAAKVLGKPANALWTTPAKV